MGPAADRQGACSDEDCNSGDNESKRFQPGHIIGPLHNSVGSDKVIVKRRLADAEYAADCYGYQLRCSFAMEVVYMVGVGWGGVGCGRATLRV